jgi:prenyltransferase beta subunit
MNTGQSFEGGMAERPDSEAHGGYAFCALACLCIIGEPHVILPKYVILYAYICVYVSIYQPES